MKLINIKNLTIDKNTKNPEYVIKKIRCTKCNRLQKNKRKIKIEHKDILRCVKICDNCESFGIMEIEES